MKTKENEVKVSKIKIIIFPLKNAKNFFSSAVFIKGCNELKNDPCIKNFISIVFLLRKNMRQKILNSTFADLHAFFDFYTL